MRARVLTAGSFAFANATVPLFPSFIMLTGVQPPGISLIPTHIALVLLAALALLGAVFTVRLLLPPRERPPTLVPLLAWLCAAILAALLGFDPAAGGLFICIFALGIVWHLCTLRFYADPFVSRAIIWSMMIACALSSLAAIVMVAARYPVAQYVIGHGRAIGTFVLPGELAGYLVIMLPIAGAVMVARSGALRAAAGVALCFGSAAFILTFSRAGWMGLAAAIAFFVVVRARASGTGILAAAGIIAAGLGAVLLLFNVAHNPSENYTRISIWQAALQIIDRFPLTGVGPFDFSRLYAVVRAPDGDVTAFHAHSVYLTFLAEIGVVGVAAAVWAWWAFAAELRRRISRTSPHEATIALAAAAGLFGTLVQGLIDTVSIVIFGLWLPTMAFALASAGEASDDT